MAPTCAEASRAAGDALAYNLLLRVFMILDASRECRCIQCYLGKISGPLLDGIDLHVEVPAVPFKELRAKDTGVTSAAVRALCALDEAGERTLELAMRNGAFRACS